MPVKEVSENSKESDEEDEVENYGRVRGREETDEEAAKRRRFLKESGVENNDVDEEINEDDADGLCQGVAMEE